MIRVLLSEVRQSCLWALDLRRAISPTLLAGIAVFFNSAVVIAQFDGVLECRMEVLFDSVDGLFRIDQGSDTPLRVYSDFAGSDAGASKPHLSPDRRTLAWVQYLPESGVGPTIWLTDLADRSSRQLVADMNSDQPAWSPDGKRLVFTSWRQGDDYLIGDLYVVDADGGGLTRLTGSDFRDEFATWSPDGTQIAYGSLRDENFDIYTMRSDGTDVLRITTHPAADFRPAWSPDGQWIAFSSSRHGFDVTDSYKYDIYVMHPDGSEVRRITRHALLALRPSWSPDGQSLVYQVGGLAADESDWEIYRVRLDEGSPKRLTDNSVTDAHPDWNTFQADCLRR
jgi:Tol biopolymer transport system component